MTADGDSDSFGPYAFNLEPAEAEAAAARLGLRAALRGGLTVRHLAPLAAFALVVIFASTLALAGLISRRAGNATLLLAAAAFMIQRATIRWRMRRARLDGLATITRLQAEGLLTAAFEDDAASLEGAGRVLRLNYADCEEAEDAGGLIYVWPRDGAPIVLPTRAVADADESARLLSRLAGRIRRSRREPNRSVARR
jgi:hypothetical protein